MSAGLPQTIWPVKRFLWIDALTVTVTFGGLGSWITRAEIAGAIITIGQFETLQEPQLIQHPVGGVVQKLMVREGDLVAPGDTLIELDTSQIRSELKIIGHKLIAIIAHQARLRSERDERELHFETWLIELAKTDNDVAALSSDQHRLLVSSNALHTQIILELHTKSAQIQSRITGLTTQKYAIETQKSVINEQLVIQKTLTDRGLAAIAAMLNLRREHQTTIAQIGGLIAEISQSNEQLIEIEIEMLQVRATRNEQLNIQLQELEFQEFNLRENQLVVQRKFENLTLKSPISGIILGLNSLSPQSVISPGETLFTIVPENRVFVIHTRIQPSNINQVYTGQSTRLRFSSTGPNAMSAPDFVGTVKTISANTLKDPHTGKSHYHIEITFPSSQLSGVESAITPTSGMPVEVFFRTNDQPVWAYLAKPLKNYFSRAFRES